MRLLNVLQICWNFVVWHFVYDHFVICHGVIVISEARKKIIREKVLVNDASHLAIVLISLWKFSVCWTVAHAKMEKNWISSARLGANCENILLHFGDEEIFYWMWTHTHAHVIYLSRFLSPQTPIHRTAAHIFVISIFHGIFSWHWRKNDNLKQKKKLDSITNS